MGGLGWFASSRGIAMQNFDLIIVKLSGMLPGFAMYMFLFIHTVGAFSHV